jgi:hypothetical protein
MADMSLPGGPADDGADSLVATADLSLPGGPADGADSFVATEDMSSPGDYCVATAEGVRAGASATLRTTDDGLSFHVAWRGQIAYTSPGARARSEVHCASPPNPAEPALRIPSEPG